jgi:hypothetical protein
VRLHRLSQIRQRITTLALATLHHRVAPGDELLGSR